MDSKEELREALLRSKPLSRKIARDYLDRPLAISEDKLDLLLQLPIDWNQIYKRFALTVCLFFPLIMAGCLQVGAFISYTYQITHSEDLQYIETDIFEIPQAKYVAIGYAVLVFFSCLISLLFLNELTHINFQFWQRYRDGKNISIQYDNDCLTPELKPIITYACPKLGCAFVKLFFITFLPYLVAVILIGSKLLILGLLVGGIVAAYLLGSFVSPFMFAVDKAVYDFLKRNNQVV